MDMLSGVFGEYIAPRAPKGQSFIKGGARITVLLPGLIRIETSENGSFCDEPTQSVLCRDFGEVRYVTADNGSSFAVKTSRASFIFTSDARLLAVKTDGVTVRDFRKGNLKGTARTLDMSCGAVRLSDGVVSKSGVALLDDSSSLILRTDGSVKRREAKQRDVYVFAYGRDYIGAVAAFFRLTGAPGLIPRFALGNWWSRYKAYTQSEYLELIKRFKKESIPISVATIDMDWHWVDVKKRFGRRALPKKKGNIADRLKQSFLPAGWTGYSWNTELFPDYKRLLSELKEMGCRITVNVHPSDGVRFFEDMYDDFARCVGADPRSKKQIEFDLTDEKFRQAYFALLHHGYERDGVDFWWIDWQQEKKTKTEGLDPLWLLNHLHYLDSAKDGKRPLILSRYCGAGAHRYPLGFSGDTVISWRSLDFAPYFTATASNVGYSWWSHDIGGHCAGVRSDEMYLRWVQFGVFSPVMRLHSTSNEFAGKEPWKYSSDVFCRASEAMRFRHRLIPYIYTMNMRTHKELRALTEPMYYLSPDESGAYNVPNEYYFGSELIVAPITRPMSKKTLMGSAKVFLPEGRFTDIFTGRIYNGGSTVTMHRDLSSIPVLARQGAIIPLSGDAPSNECKNPESLEILIYRGEGEFTLYEDDGETLAYKNGAYALTRFAVTEKNGDVIFTLDAPKGDLSVLPERRGYTLSFRDVVSCEKVLVTSGSKRIPFTREGMKISVKPAADASVRVRLKGIEAARNPDKKEALTELFSKIQGGNDVKQLKYTPIINGDLRFLGLLDKDVRSAAEEILYCDT